MKDKTNTPKPNDLASFIESKGRALRANELADLLGVSPSLIYKETRAGLIPYIKIGGTVRYDCLAIAEWLRGITIIPRN